MLSTKDYNAMPYPCQTPPVYPLHTIREQYSLRLIHVLLQNYRAITFNDCITLFGLPPGNKVGRSSCRYVRP